MPIFKCPNGNYRIGAGKCAFKNKEKAIRAYQAYLAQIGEIKNGKKINIETTDNRGTG